MLAPPINSMASNTKRVVKLVFKDLPIVSIMLVFTNDVKDLSGCLITFSRILSNTTIVSLTLYPATVSIPMIKVALTSILNTLPSIENIPRTNSVSWMRAMIALMPYRYAFGALLNAYHM